MKQVLMTLNSTAEIQSLGFLISMLDNAMHDSVSCALLCSWTGWPWTEHLWPDLGTWLSCALSFHHCFGICNSHIGGSESMNAVLT